MQTLASPPPYFLELLKTHLRAFLGDLEPATLALLMQHLQWVEIRGGQALMRQGEPGDAMYVLVSGRLRTLVAGDDGQARAVREITRGEVVGEMSLYTDAPRSATLVAMRDSVLVRLGKDEFKQLLATSGLVSLALTRQIIQRLSTEGTGAAQDAPVNIGLLPITAGVDAPAFAAGLAAQLRTAGRPGGRVALVDSARMTTALGAGGFHGWEADDADLNRRVAAVLDEIEAAHDAVLLVGDADATPWTRVCARQSDELLLLADADAPPVLQPVEQACLMQAREPGTGPAEVLVLLHPESRLAPRGTAAWLARRPVADHVHIRPTLERDMRRLARLQSRTAVGLVLAGGGARGFSHLGLYQALLERGVEIDMIGGTSMGAAMGVGMASDQPWGPTVDKMRKAFALGPTSDFNLLPMLSLIKGRRLKLVIETCILDVFGHMTHIEDLWKGYFCVATNYSKAREEVLRHGALAKALQASVAIPGALPPVIERGDLLCDGGTFNNFPVDVMRRMRGIGRVLGADLTTGVVKRIRHEHTPSSWELLRDRLLPRKLRRYRLPSMAAYLMNVTVLYSMSRRPRALKQTDVFFNPPLLRVGLLQWSAFDTALRQGYEHACGVLDREEAARGGTVVTPAA